MSWRKLTMDDLTSRLSLAEIEAYSHSAAFGDPVGELIVQTTEEVRGYIASGRKCKMGPDGTIPGICIAATLSLIVVRLIGRIDIAPNEARTQAATDAYTLLNKISTGEVIPEDYGETPKETDKLATAPAFAAPHPVRLLD